MPGGESECAAVSGVNVIPAIIFQGDLRQFQQGINYAGRSCTGKTNDATRNGAGVAIFIELLAQRIGLNMKIMTGGNLTQAGAAEAENVHASFNRKMDLLRSVNNQIARQRSQTSLYCGLMSAIAGALEGNQVCFGASARERAKTFRAVANQFAQPAQHPRFDHCRGWSIAPRACILVEDRCQCVGPNANRQGGGIELAKITRAGDLHRMHQYFIGEAIENLFGSYSLLRKRLVEDFLEVVGSR